MLNKIEKHVVQRVLMAIAIPGLVWGSVWVVDVLSNPKPNEANLFPPRSAMNDPRSQELSDYVEKMIDVVQTDISPVKRKPLVRSIVSAVKDAYPDLESQKRIIRVLAIESGFDTNAHSSAGAIGLAQVMPQYAKEFSKDCGLGDYKDSDLSYSDVNLVIGICRLKKLSDLYPEGMTRVLVAYNAGTASAQIKQLEALANITSVETSSYVAKYYYLSSLAELPLEKIKEIQNAGRNRSKQVAKAKDSTKKK